MDTRGISPHLVVSNGHHREPRFPNYQGEFSGEFLHYWLSHPFFDKNFIDYSEGPVPLYLKMFHPDYCNLYFIGMFQPLGCIWPGVELPSKLMAQELMGTWKRPKKIRELCEKQVTPAHYRPVNSPRHSVTVNYHLLMKALRKTLPKSQVSKIPQQNMDSEMVST
ncbi:hypothetical protein [Algoriphagus boritolerans]|uniref:hypothetical protein n=1 Tax=Algoriphagus boritolerans TaxID=308111 RepID=UPI002FCDFAE6